MFVELAMMAIYGEAHSKECIQSCWVLRRVLDLVVRGRDVDGEGSKGCLRLLPRQPLSTCNKVMTQILLSAHSSYECSLLMYMFLQAVGK